MVTLAEMTPYREEDSGPFYRAHFLGERQSGGPIPVYAGKEIMGGRGFGSVLSGLMRSAAPLLKRGAGALLNRGLAIGRDAASDILAGKNVGQALKRSAQSQADDIFGDVLGALQPDEVKAKRSRPKKRRKTTKRKTLL